MDSPGYISRLQLNRRFLPLAAVLADDLKQSLRHWALWLWAGLSLVSAVVWFIQASPDSQEVQISVSAYPGVYAEHQPITPLAVVPPKASDIVGKAIVLHLSVLAALVVAFSATSIAGESDYLSGSVLCRGVSRWQYFVGKAVSRASVVVAGFLLLTLPLVIAAMLRLENDLTWRGTISVLTIGSVLLALIAACGVSGSAWFRNPMVAAAAVGLALYGAGVVATALEIERFSPVILTDSLVARLAEASPGPLASSIISCLGIGTVLTCLASATRFAYGDR